MLNSRKLFDDSEAAHPLTEEEMIKVENIKGTLFVVAAEDDVLWDTAKYVRRMQARLSEKPHDCETELVVYKHGTHFVFPDSMIKTMLPVGSSLFVKLAFRAARQYPKECRETRIDIPLIGKDAHHFGVCFKLRNGFNQRFAQAECFLHRVYPDSL